MWTGTIKALVGMIRIDGGRFLLIFIKFHLLFLNKYLPSPLITNLVPMRFMGPSTLVNPPPDAMQQVSVQVFAFFVLLNDERFYRPEQFTNLSMLEFL